MRLFIAEKAQSGPSHYERLGNMLSGKDISSVVILPLPGALAIFCKEYDPEDYDKNLHAWRLEDLPIIPDHWKNKISASSKEQYAIIKDLVSKVDCIVNAGRSRIVRGTCWLMKY